MDKISTQNNFFYVTDIGNLCCSPVTSRRIVYYSSKNNNNRANDDDNRADYNDNNRAVHRFVITSSYYNVICLRL